MEALLELKRINRLEFMRFTEKETSKSLHIPVSLPGTVDDIFCLQSDRFFSNPTSYAVLAL